MCINLFRENSIAVGSPVALTTADINADGFLDLIAASGSAHSVAVQLGNGAGGFVGLGSFATGASPGGVVAADINGDGRPDLIVGSTGSQRRSITVLTNNGSGFNAPQSFLVEANPQFVAAADLNGDGKQDVVVGNRDAKSVSVLLNAGSTLGAAASYALSASPTALALADLNGDGKRDVVVGSAIAATLGTPASTQISVLANDGAGKLQAPVVTSVAGVSIQSLAIGDLNGDGRADVIFSNSSSPSIGILLGLGNGGFQAATYLSTGPFFSSTPGDLALSDIDRDGKLDAVFAVPGSNSLAVARGRGDGTFMAPTSFAVGSSPTALSLGDFNGDGGVDIAAAASTASIVTPVLNLSFAVLPGIAQAPDTATASEAGGIGNATLGLDPSGNVLGNDKGTGLSVVGLAYVSGSGGGQPGKLGSPLSGSYGSLSLQANGDYAYVVDQARAQFLSPGQFATDVFAYTVKDANGALATTTLSVNVNGANDAPIASALPDVTLLSGPTNSYSWNFVAPAFSDPDGGAIFYSVQLAGGGPLPSWVGFSSSSRQFFSNGAGFGTVPIRMTGTDAFGATASAVFTLNAMPQLISVTALTPAQSEGNGGSTPFEFQISRTGDTAAATTVAWAAAGSGPTPASASDFAGGVLPSGTVSFLAGETTRTITVNVAGDAAKELSEGFAVTLTKIAADTGIATATARATIIDDDTPAPVANRLLFAAASPQAGYELWVTDGTPAGTGMADLNPGPRGSYPQGFRTSDMGAFGNGVLFNANDGVHGRELWFSDGTAAGTRMVTDALTAPNVGTNPRYFTAVGGRAFFTGFTPSTSRELWVTDGTAAGTKMVKDINSGYGRSTPRDLTALNGRLLFSAYTAATGRELWISDSTEAGTSMVLETIPGASSGNPRNMVVLGDTALFAATSSAGGEELWRTDGTAAGTYEVADINAGAASSSPQNMFVFGNKVLFSGIDGANGRELIITDGTKAGTQALADVNPGTASSNPSDFARVGGKVVFSATGAAGSELWVTDGTAGGTARIATAPTLSGGFKYQTAVGGRVVFAGFNAANGGELWSTDGTAAGTALLADINPGPDGSEPGNFRLMGNRVLFTATDPVNGSSLWSTDGTAAGTQRVTTPYPGFDPGSQPISRGSGLPGPRINAVNGRTVFAAADTSDGNGNPSDRVLWVTTGTSVGTRKLYSSAGSPVVLGRAQNQADGGNTYPMITLGNRMLFTAWDSSRGYELWATDGTQAGTNVVSDIFAGSGGSYASNFGSLDGTRALFSARDSSRGYELWVSDGTTAGTRFVKDINPGDASTNSYPNSFRQLGSKALFNANDGTNGVELWITDGTGPGTRMVRDINTAAGEGSLPRNLTVVNSQVVFFAQSASNGPMNLWRTDGTEAGTTLVKTVAYTTPRRLSGAMPVAGGKAFFAGDDGTGEQLWMTDGTAAGTSVVAAINPGGASAPTEMVALGSKIVFAANDGSHGRELWITDGTAAGTSMISDIVAGAGASNPDVLTTFGSKVLFQATDAAHGSELWITDGTAAGTMLLKDIAPGAAGSSPTGISVRNGLAFFQANDGATGYELWVTNGTAAGTRLVKNIVTEQAGPRPVNLTPFTGPSFTPGVANLEVTATNATRAEGSGGTTAFTFTVTRSGVTTNAVNVNWSVSGLLPDAAAAGDFAGGILPSGTVSFTAGQTSKLVTVNVAADTLVERDKQFQVTLSAPTGGAVIARATANGTILDDDTNLAIAPLAAVQSEGNAGTTAFTFTVTRAGILTGTSTAKWAVTGNTVTPAIASDFAGGVLPSGAVTFLPGETARTITVDVAGDTSLELNDGFAVTLSAATGATIVTPSASGTIVNDDSRFAIAAISANKPEGSSGGTTPFTFTVSRTGQTSVPQFVNYAVAPGTAVGTLPADAADLAGGVFPSGVLTFGAGVTSQTITVNVAADTATETNESFAVTLTGATGGGVITTATAQGIITTDDTNLAIVGTSASQTEGQSGSKPFTFTVTRTGILTGTSTVNWAVAGSGAAPANAADFANGILPSGALTFLPSETSKVITVQVAGDTAAESTEGFTVALSGAVGTTLATPSAIGSIINDDTNLAIAPLSAVLSEGNAGTTAFTFTVTRTGILTGTSTANWAVTGNTATPAIASDFPGGVLPSGVVTFLANQSTRTITVNVAGDTSLELNDGFAVTLSAPTGATIATPSASGTIVNDDSTFAIAATSANKPEGNSGGTTPFTFTVTRAGQTAVPQFVNYAVTPGTAVGTNPANTFDFPGGVLPTGLLTFGAGVTTQTVTVNIVADTAKEINESFAVTLSGATGGAVITTATAQGVILADEFASTPGSETLTGTDGPDLFLLGGGLDTVVGKAGTDLFQFLPSAIGAAASNATTLQDFSRAAGEVINLSAIDAIAGTVGDDPFSFIGTAAFGGVAGQLRWTDLGGVRLIQGDVNGDGTADLTTFVTAAGPVEPTWFIL